MQLRAHHLLCIQKFTGHGYDAAFTANLTAICALLHAEPQTSVILTAGCDLLCEACPHRTGDCCDNADKVSALDKAVLETCGLPRGTAAPWAELAAVCRRRILKTDLFHRVCGGCQWYDLCSETEAAHEEILENG